jgi:hypothetical protein
MRSFAALATTAGLLAAAPTAGAPTVSQADPDRTRPVVHLLAPGHASDFSLGRRFQVRWFGTDRGSGIARYRLEARRSTNVSPRWRTVIDGTTDTTAAFRGRPGVTYLFRLRARDRAGNLSRYDYDQTVVPRDDRSRHLRYSRGWHRIRRGAAYGRTLTRARRAGLTAHLTFRGSRVALIARRVRGGGSLLVTVDGRSRVVRLAGTPRYRQAVLHSRQLPPGLHLLTIRTLGGGIADLDAVGVHAGPGPPR